MSRSSSARLSDARLSDRAAGFVNHLHRFGHTLHSSLPSEMSTERLAGVFNVQCSLEKQSVQAFLMHYWSQLRAESALSIDHVTESPQGCRQIRSFEIVWAASNESANKRFDPFLAFFHCASKNCWDEIISKNARAIGESFLCGCVTMLRGHDIL